MASIYAFGYGFPVLMSAMSCMRNSILTGTHPNVRGHIRLCLEGVMDYDNQSYSIIFLTVLYLPMQEYMQNSHPTVGAVP
jgi:hypothetical protein